MIETAMKHEVSFFGDMSHIQPSVDTIQGFLELFRDVNLLPSTFLEIHPGSSERRLRLRLSTPEQPMKINVSSEAITIYESIGELGTVALGPLTDFVDTAAEWLTRIIERYPRKAGRLAIITEGLGPDMSDNDLKDAYAKLINPIEFYSNTSPYEWSVHSVAGQRWQIAGNEEPINVISTVKRVRGQMMSGDNVLDFDRLMLSFDINTFQEDTEPRFTMDSAQDLWKQAIEIRAELLGEWKARLYG